MKAAVLDRFGPPAMLQLREVPRPEPGPNEVLIALHAAGVGIWDAEIRKGWWPEGQPHFPLVLGSDGAGVVAGCGTQVRRFHEGDRVWASEFINPKGGFYAEYVAVSAEHVGLAPKGLGLMEAGAAAVTGLTALQGLEEHLRLRSGETVLVFGASGAVGSLAVQFARWQGARVLATARGAKATRFVTELGVQGVVDLTERDGLEQLRALAPELDAVLALAGGEALQSMLAQLRPGARLAYPNGVEPAPRSTPKVKPISYDAEATPRHFERLAQAVEESRLRVPLAAVYPLKQAAQAHRRLERGQVLGRIALQLERHGK